MVPETTRLSFVMGSRIRRVLINGRTISLLDSATNFVPLEIDLDKLEQKGMKDKLKEAKIDKSTLKELGKLKTRDQIIKDIKKDFQSVGWRLVQTQK